MAAVVAVEVAVCECCGLQEECTPPYITRVRERFFDKFLCGLCAEAVKYEVCRSKIALIKMEEALNAHMAFCKQFRVGSCSKPAVSLVGAVRQLLKRSLLASSALPRSAPSSPRRSVADSPPASAAISRTGSCFSTLAR